MIIYAIVIDNDPECPCIVQANVDQDANQESEPVLESYENFYSESEYTSDDSEEAGSEDNNLVNIQEFRTDDGQEASSEDTIIVNIFESRPNDDRGECVEV